MTTISNNNVAHALYLNSKGKNGKELTDFSINATRFLFRRRLTAKIPDILKHLENMIHREEGTIVVKIITAHKLSHDTKNELSHSLKKRYNIENVILEEIMEPKLLRGYRIEVNDEVIDLSMKNKISQLQQHLIN